MQKRMHLFGIADLNLRTKFRLLDLHCRSQERYLSFLHPLCHSRMNDLLVNDHTINEFRVHQALPLLLHKLNIVDISDKRFSSLLNNLVNSLDSYLRKMLGGAPETLSAHRRNSDLPQSLSILQVHRFRDLIQNLFGSLSRLLVTRIDHRRMDSLVQQKLRPFQKLTRENYRCSSAISNLIILSLGHFNKHFRSRVLNI